MYIGKKVSLFLNNKSLAMALRLPVELLMVATVFLIFVPFAPAMPTGLNPLDPSWVFGMNVAASQHLVFGSDLLFTYGPYASIFTRTYHPFTDPLALWGSIYLAFTYAVALIFITRKSSILWLLVSIAAFSFIKQYTDVLLSTYALIMGVLCYQIISISTDSKKASVGLLVLTFVLFIPFGLYPLVKGSVYVLCFTVALLSVGLLAYFKKWYLALSIPISIIVSLIFFWSIAGQSIADLPSYFGSLGIIISGYSDAMSITGNKYEIFAYLASSLFLVLMLFKKRGLNIGSFYLVLIFSLFLFISFKGGFIRHDGHAVYGVAALYFAAVLFFVVFPSYPAMMTLMLACLTFIYIDSHYDNALYLRRLAPVSETYHWGIYGVKKRLFDSTQFLVEYDRAVDIIKKEARFPELSGTVDTYPVDQSRIIASGYNWVPRPVFQSYAAYNPQLAKINHDHILSAKAPDNIIFRVFTIDNRYPSLDDGLSWPTILANYHLTDSQGEFLFLKKNQEKNNPAILCEIGSGVYSMGQTIAVPINPDSHQDLSYVEIDIKPTVLGRVMNVLFKTSEMRILVQLNNGQSRDYRITPSMAKSGFILSPLIENTNDFKKLIPKENRSTLNLVRSFSITPVNQFWQWNKEFRVDFKTAMKGELVRSACPN
jgi:hypothetical protein